MLKDVDRVTLVRDNGIAVRFDGLVVYRRETVEGALARIERETGLRLFPDPKTLTNMEPSLASNFPVRRTVSEAARVLELEDRLARALQLLHDIDDLSRHDELTHREFMVMAAHLAERRSEIMSDAEFYDLRERVNSAIDRIVDLSREAADVG